MSDMLLNNRNNSKKKKKKKHESDSEASESSSMESGSAHSKASSKQASSMNSPVIMVQPVVMVPQGQYGMMTPPGSVEAGPVLTQPGNVPAGLQKMPAGMQMLAQMKAIKIKQNVMRELMETLLCGCCEFTNVYDLMEPDKREALFKAREHSNCCKRNCCGHQRGFVMEISDLNDQRMFTSERPFKCGNCLCTWNCCNLSNCCKDEIVVKGPDGEEYGRVIERWSLYKTCYYVHDHSGEIKYKITGPCCACTCAWPFSLCCCARANFWLFDYHTKVKKGTIFKGAVNILQELFTDADTFGIEFPPEADVKMKAVLIGAVFLIDMKHFEDKDSGADVLL